MFDPVRLATMRAALYGPAAGRTTAALVEALDRIRAPEHGPLLFFVVDGPSQIAKLRREDASRIAAALDIPVEVEVQCALYLPVEGAKGVERRELRFVTIRQFMEGPEVLGRSWGGRREPPFVADPGVLDLLWRMRRKA